MSHAIEDLGYRRLEWKCDTLNAASRRAAERYGFTFEGIFRQAVIVKGRNRDTAWFSILDKERPVIACALRRWLGDENFDTDGEQLFSPGDIRHQIVSRPAAASAVSVLGSAVRGCAPGYVGDESAGRGLVQLAQLHPPRR